MGSPTQVIGFEVGPMSQGHYDSTEWYVRLTWIGILYMEKHIQFSYTGLPRTKSLIGCYSL